MFVNELSKKQLLELKRTWFQEFIQETENRDATDKELEIVDGYISDDALMEQYKNTVFHNADFDCTSDIPDLETLKKQYNEIADIMKNVKTVEDARQLENSLGIYIEIGPKDGDAEHCTWYGFDDLKESDIEWFRVESWGDLGYLYFNTNGKVFFDVFDCDDTIIDSTSIDKLEQAYSELLV